MLNSLFELMNKQELIAQIQQKKSFLCIGLDVDLAKIPKHLLAEEDPIFEFNKQLIDATHHLTVAYKPNTAFYEAYGIKGWQALERQSTILMQIILKFLLLLMQNVVILEILQLCMPKLFLKI